jgi:hypothetical protein
MGNDLVHDDDSFGRSERPNNRPRHYLKWTASDGWHDQDDLAPPEILVLVKLSSFLQRWTKVDGRNVPTTITDHPLPDINELNASIPENEWPIGRNGEKKPPFKHYCGFTLVNPVTGTQYFFANSTIGVQLLYNDMDESVSTVRAIRGDRCFPIVKLGQTSWTSRKWGSVLRPHFEILQWKVLGGGNTGDQVSAPAPAPQLTGPVLERTPEEPKPTATPTSTQPRQPKKPITVSAYTQAVMGALPDSKPVTTDELLDDSLENLPWDDQ